MGNTHSPTEWSSIASRLKSGTVPTYEPIVQRSNAPSSILRTTDSFAGSRNSALLGTTLTVDYRPTWLASANPVGGPPAIDWKGITADSGSPRIPDYLPASIDSRITAGSSVEGSESFVRLYPVSSLLSDQGGKIKVVEKPMQ